MTGPDTGYPDYARLNLQAGFNLATFFAPWHTNPTTGVIDCHGVGFLNIAYSTIGDTAQGIVFMAWFADQALTQQVLVNQFMPPFTSFGVQQFPVVARWVTVTAFWEGGSTTDQVLVNVYGSNVRSPEIHDDPDVIPPCRIEANFPVSSSLTSLLTSVFTGPATFNVVSRTTVMWSADVEYYDWNTGTWQTLIFLLGSKEGNYANETIALPPCPMRITLANLDGAANHFLFGALQPWYH